MRRRKPTCHSLCSAVDPKWPSIGVTRRSANDTLLMCELFRTPRATVPREIAWSGNDHAARIGKLPHCEIRIRQIADPNGEIVAFADEIDIAVGQIQIDFDPRWSFRNAGRAGTT
jgi:hypothetical protein